jgi:DNA polymerase-3 subunit epsilon/ATP-dependent DNA helicase DinG
MQSIVALDLETTGLDPTRDAVIEIGAVRFQGSRIEDTWQSLINPGRPVPPFVKQLTGIDDAMLVNAPRFTSILNEFQEFVGDLPVLGHNVSFDLSFLLQRGLFQYNQPIDTYDLASVLIPSAGRYRLDALANALGVIPQQHHRALEDAQTTHQVYLRLIQLVQELPEAILEEIVILGEEIEWGAGWVFDEVIRDREVDLSKRSRIELFPVTEEKPIYKLTPSDEPQPLDPEEISAILEPSGPFDKEFEGYEHRSQQISMIQAIAEAFSISSHLLVEAGTGIGKSLAYLIPAFKWAETNGQRVVVSTNTINLQDQLRGQDIPTINRVLGTDYRGAVLKGRRNYLCPRRLNAMRRLGPRSAEEMRVLAKILVWLNEGGSGDRNEINLIGDQEATIWWRLSAETEDCSPEICSRYGGESCPYFIARNSAETAHVIIVNHALLLADIGTGNRVIPEYQYLIVDEAHHLEAATTNGLSFSVTENNLKRNVDELGVNSPGYLHSIRNIGRHSLPPDQSAKLDRMVQSTIQLARECSSLISELFKSLDIFLLHQRDDEPVGTYGQQVRILPSTRTLPDWGDVEVSWENVREPLISLIQIIMDISEDLLDLAQESGDANEDMVVAIRSSARTLHDQLSQLDQMIFEPDPKMIYWLHISSHSNRIFIHAAPLEIGHLVEKHLWHEKQSVILTSATLTTAGEFQYINQRLNAHDAETLPLGSPFDYENSTLLYLLNDIPEPQDRQNYQRAVERGILNLCKATNGRTLVLFTSYDQLRRTARAISSPLAAEGIYVFEQGEGASRHALLETFRTTEQAVLLGTRSFWEGVDVPGSALSVLVITRLPFDVPSDPIVAARAETYEMPFDQYTVPEAILRFRQGFGRLIRTKSDRGVVAVFDRRILSKRYGAVFIDSLPNCTTRTGSISNLPDAAARWIGD